MHTCCAPCSVYCIDLLRKEGIEPVVYWFNPNIHPYMEYKARRDTLKEYTKQDGSKDIRDPWGFYLETYRFCAVEIEKAIRVLVEKIKE